MGNILPKKVNSKFITSDKSNPTSHSSQNACWPTNVESIIFPNKCKVEATQTNVHWPISGRTNVHILELVHADTGMVSKSYDEVKKKKDDILCHFMPRKWSNMPRKLYNMPRNDIAIRTESRWSDCPLAGGGNEVWLSADSRVLLWVMDLLWN